MLVRVILQNMLWFYYLANVQYFISRFFFVSTMDPKGAARNRQKLVLGTQSINNLISDCFIVKGLYQLPDVSDY